MDCLNRHWDINSDGRVDVRELEKALAPLVGPAAQNAAAQILVLVQAERASSLSMSDLGLLLSQVKIAGFKA